MVHIPKLNELPAKLPEKRNHPPTPPQIPDSWEPELYSPQPIQPSTPNTRDSGILREVERVASVLAGNRERASDVSALVSEVPPETGFFGDKMGLNQEVDDAFKRISLAPDHPPVEDGLDEDIHGEESAAKIALQAEEARAAEREIIKSIADLQRDFEEAVRNGNLQAMTKFQAEIDGKERKLTELRASL